MELGIRVKESWVCVRSQPVLRAGLSLEPQAALDAWLGGSLPVWPRPQLSWARGLAASFPALSAFSSELSSHASEEKWCSLHLQPPKPARLSASNFVETYFTPDILSRVLSSTYSVFSLLGGILN